MPKRPLVSASDSPYKLSDEMLAAIQTRGTSDAPAIRSLADEFHVPFYWMREQVLAHGRGVDHALVERNSLQEEREFVRAAAKLDPTIAPTLVSERVRAPSAPVTQHPAPEGPGADDDLPLELIPPEELAAADAALTRACARCGTSFTVAYRTSPRRYCTTDCYYASRTKAEPVKRACAECGVEFTVPPTNPSQRYCSRACSHKKGRRIVLRAHIPLEPDSPPSPSSPPPSPSQSPQSPSLPEPAHESLSTARVSPDERVRIRFHLEVEGSHAEIVALARDAFQPIIEQMQQRFSGASIGSSYAISDKR